VRQVSVVVGVVLLASGCMMGATQQREENLVRTARMFNDDLRWARFEQMTGSMPADEARAFTSRVELVRDELVIADFEVTSINFAQGSEKATVMVKLEWYTKREPTVRNTTIEEKWEFRPGGWMMVKQRRTRGDRFPLTPEPASTVTSPDRAPDPASPDSPPSTRPGAAASP
jgi:hypothetical protein